MIEWLKRNKAWIFALIYATLAAAFWNGFNGDRSNSLLAGVYFVLFFVCCWRMFVWFMRFFRERVAPTALSAAKRIASFFRKTIGAAFSRLAAKFGFTRRGQLIRGSDTVEFLSFSDTKKKKKVKPFKLGKYTDCDGDAERVRYIYTAYLLQCRKKGYSIMKTKTPAEISVDTAGTDGQKLIFTLYEDVRYGDEKVDVKTVESAYSALDS